MKPVDFRNETFRDLQGRISGQRELVLRAWEKHGPGTTAQLAERSGISILNVRPRTTELIELGFVMLAEEQPAKGEGIYRARTYSELMHWFAAHQREAQPGQRLLSL